MRYLFFLLVSICSFGQESQPQFNYKATYKLTYQIDSTNQNSTVSENMVLYLDENHSRFSSHGKAVEDSLMENRDKSNKSMAEFYRIKKLTPETEFHYKIFKDRQTQEIWLIEKIFKDKVKYQEPLSLQEWQIKSETSKISGYPVQKATTNFRGREYVAWFTPEIPIPEGPYKFNGLPGFIIDISDDKNHYHFRLTSFKKLQLPVSKILETEAYKTVSRKDFLKIKDNFKRDPLSAMSGAGIKIGWSGDDEANAKRELKEKYDSENNPIELR